MYGAQVRNVLVCCGVKEDIGCMDNRHRATVTPLLPWNVTMAGRTQWRRWPLGCCPLLCLWHNIGQSCGKHRRWTATSFLQRCCIEGATKGSDAHWGGVVKESDGSASIAISRDASSYSFNLTINTHVFWRVVIMFSIVAIIFSLPAFNVVKEDNSAP